MRGRGVVIVENQETENNTGRVLSATTSAVLEEPSRPWRAVAVAVRTKSAAVEEMRGTAGIPAVYPPITGFVLRLVTE